MEKEKCDEPISADSKRLSSKKLSGDGNLKSKERYLGLPDRQSRKKKQLSHQLA